MIHTYTQEELQKLIELSLLTEEGKRFIADVLNTPTREEIQKINAQNGQEAVVQYMQKNYGWK